MSFQPFQGFQHFTTQHCITGSMRHIYAHHNYPISEELLLGLGAGIGFVYWHSKGTLPFLGGRANVGRPGEEGLEKTAGRRTGVLIDCLRTSSPTRAERSLLEQLRSKQPVMLMLDMGYLPYFDFGEEEFHFGGHAVVACGYDPDSDQVLIADRDEELHPVTLQAVAQARGSKHPPFPPQHAWYTFDFAHCHPLEKTEIFQAINECTDGMLNPPISNLGVRGILKAAQRIRQWPEALDEQSLRLACINTAIMIDARGGTGGGLFRCMYGHFLAEASKLTGWKDLATAGLEFQSISQSWDEIAGLFERAYTAKEPGVVLNEISAWLPTIAGREEKAWQKLQQIVETVKEGE